jgi:ATP-dependent DNA ligase
MIKLENDVYSRVPYSSKLKQLEKIFKNGKRITVAPTVEGTGAEEVAAYFDKWVMSKKTEGLVLRNESGIIQKLKPQVSIDAVIIGFGERANSYPDLGQMIVALIRGDGRYHILGTVGGGFSDDDRRDWYDRLIKMEIESDYKLSNKHGTLCRFVRPEIIVEIRCSEVIAADSKDNPDPLFS